MFPVARVPVWVPVPILDPLPLNGNPVEKYIPMVDFLIGWPIDEIRITLGGT